MLASAFERAGLGAGAVDFAILWDFVSLFQKPRSDDQTVLFKQGLGALPMWYGHAETVMWMQPELPEGFGEQMAKLGLAESYETSGWCFVESSVSAGVKRSDRRLDLGLQTEKALGWAYGGQTWIPEACLDRVCAARRPPPLSPEKVAGQLRSGAKKFTNSADVEPVIGLYRSYFEGVTTTATTLAFAELQWEDSDAEELAPLLPQYVRVTSLDVSKNRFGARGASALASNIGAMAELTKIW